MFVFGQLALAWGSPLPEAWTASGRPWIDMWARWDSSWYLSIATSGYEYLAGQPSNVGHFPLYPLLIRTLSISSQDLAVLVVIGWIIANTATLVAFYLLYRLILLDDGPDVGRRTIWLLAFFPTSFYLSTVYSEGLFLALTVAAFYAARRRRWLAAGLLGGLSALTRSIGVFLVLPLAWEWYQQRPRRWSAALPLLLIPLGLVTHMIYLGFRFGDPLIYSSAQTNWGRSTSLSVAIEHINGLMADPVSFLRGRGVTTYEVLFLLLAMLLLIVVLRKQRLSYGIFAGYAIAIPLTSFLTAGIPRYMIVAFPLFIALAQIVSRPILFRLILIAAAILQIILVVRWTLGYWLA